MLTQEPLCIIRHDDDINFMTKGMSCQKIIEELPSGRWGSQCRIQEVYLYGPEFPNVLRNIGLYSEDIGFQIIEVDEDFDTFILNSNELPPESPGLKTLRSFLEK